LKKGTLILSLLTALTMYANECVCFELKGEFGEEIKEILKKYTKNLGDKDIKIIKEDSDLKKQQSFLDSLSGIASTGTFGSQEVSAESFERAKLLYHSQCASCHGENGETVVGKSAIRDMSKQNIEEALYSYTDESYNGPARFIKKSAASTMTKIEMRSLAEYVTTQLKTKGLD